VQPTRGSGHGERVAGQHLPGLLGQHSEHVLSVDYAGLSAPLLGLLIAGFGRVQIEHDQPGRAGGQPDVVRGAGPGTADALRVGGGALLPPLVPAGTHAGAGAPVVAVQRRHLGVRP
jgi:hypothetical protein